MNEDHAIERLVDLGDVADSLSKRFPAIHGMYLFGSRAFGTGSVRSDIDILLESDGYIRPGYLRQFASGELAALDLFLVEGGRATSTQNETYIEAENSIALFELLRAKKFWDRQYGRLGADICWKQSVRKDVEFPPTALPMSLQKGNDTPTDVDSITWDQIFRAFRSSPIKKTLTIIATILALLGVVFSIGVGYGYEIGTGQSSDMPKPEQRTNR